MLYYVGLSVTRLKYPVYQCKIPEKSLLCGVMLKVSGSIPRRCLTMFFKQGGSKKKPIKEGGASKKDGKGDFDVENL